MATYIFKNEQTGFECMYRYNESGIQIAFEVRSDITDADLLQYLSLDFSLLTTLQRFVAVKPERKLLLVPEDLSFQRFWETYGHKVGKKARVEKLWNALSEGDKIKCLAAIPRYKAWLAQRPNMEMLYPETFISQRRFENTFK
jgi:hypothetical protein